MVQPGEYDRFLLEPLQEGRIPQAVRRRDLDRDLSIEAGVVGEVDSPMPPRPRCRRIR